MHSRHLKKAGETDERLFALAAWRDAPYFTDGERAALALAEAVTRLSDRSDPVPDEIWNEVARHYDERALAELAIAQKMRKYYRWWYLAELDPLYARFRSEPRFRALTDQARQYRVEQRALLEQMRSKGEVPKRG